MTSMKRRFVTHLVTQYWNTDVTLLVDSRMIDLGDESYLQQNTMSARIVNEGIAALAIPMVV